MAKEICISSTPHETRLAILEDDQLSEIYYERENEYTLAGSIYNGRVTRVLPGMQSAFVDLGLERDAFLYVTDFLELEDQDESDELEKAAAAGQSTPARGSPRQRPERRTRTPARTSPRGGGSRRPRGRTGTPTKRGAPGTEASPAEQPSVEISADNADAEPAGEAGEAGAKRWRGRRRRRGGRATPGHVADPVDTEASAETYLEPGIFPNLTLPRRFTPRLLLPWNAPLRLLLLAGRSALNAPNARRHASFCPENRFQNTAVNPRRKPARGGSNRRRRLAPALRSSRPR